MSFALPFILLACIPIYFVPTIVANRRGHNQRLAILMLNIFLGWTLLGWVVALVWACTTDVSPKLDVTRAIRRRP
jgi:hypothetical protein